MTINISSISKRNVSVSSQNVLVFILKNNFSYLYKTVMLAHIEYTFLVKFDNGVLFSDFHKPFFPLLLENHDRALHFDFTLRVPSYSS